MSILQPETILRSLQARERPEPETDRPAPLVPDFTRAELRQIVLELMG